MAVFENERKKPDDNISKSAYVELYCTNHILCIQFVPDDNYREYCKNIPDDLRSLFDPYVSYPFRKILYGGAHTSWHIKYYPAYEIHPCVAVMSRSMSMTTVDPYEGIISFYEFLKLCNGQAKWSNFEIVFGSVFMKNVAAAVSDYMKIPFKGFDDANRDPLLYKKIIDDLGFIIEQYELKNKIEIGPVASV